MMFATRQSRARLAAAAVIAALCPGFTAWAAVINVPSGPAPTIQVAINIATSGDEIIVAPGTYFEKLSLLGKTLTIRSSAGPQTTIIDALGQLDPVIKIISAEGAATLIEGFTLRNGVATDPAPNERGGGIYCNLTSPTIRNCNFTQNTAWAGGAFYANGGTPRLEGCTFVSNNAIEGSGGGALYLNSTTCTMIDCVFAQNHSTYYAGAIYAVSTAVKALRCEFAGNDAVYYGGAVWQAAGAAGTLYEQCRFYANVANDAGVGAVIGGGAVATSTTTGPLEWRNCTFESNHTGGSGGALQIWDASNAIILNCSFSGNAAAGSGGGGAIWTEPGTTANARNCIAWGNTPNGFNASTAATYCNIQNVLPGAGNMSLDPMFTNAAGGDLRILEGSPCIDSGNSTLVPMAVAGDFDGLPRVVNGLAAGATGLPAFGYFVDMGAFEFRPEGSGGCSGCAQDVNCDGAVNFDDVLEVLFNWGACP